MQGQGEGKQDWIDMLIKPMEPVSQKEPFNSDKHLFELKWDGIRILAFSNGSRLRLQNRNLRDRTEKFPELHSLSKAVKAREFILDGEMVVLWQGKPSFHRVMERTMASSERSVKEMQRRLPVIYVVFDILYYNGQWLLDWPLEDRKSILGELVVKGPHLDLSEPLAGEGTEIFRAVVRQELEGIVAKARDSRYLIGRKDRKWLKIKRRITQDCVILGFYPAGECVTSLIMGAYLEGRLVYIGRVSSGLSDASGRKIYKLLAPEVTTAHPGDLLKRHKGAVWVKPVFTAEVEFMEWTEDFKMRAPVFRGLLPKTDPRECEIK